jgi:hypothetical protein
MGLDRHGLSGLEGGRSLARALKRIWSHRDHAAAYAVQDIREAAATGLAKRGLAVLTGRAARAGRGIWPVGDMLGRSFGVQRLRSRRVFARALIVGGSVRLFQRA